MLLSVAGVEILSFGMQYDKKYVALFCIVGKIVQYDIAGDKLIYYTEIKCTHFSVGHQIIYGGVTYKVVSTNPKK